MSLNRQQFGPPDDWEDEPPSRSGYFHGSKTPMEAGDTIVPGYTIGKENYDYDFLPTRSDGTGQHEHVYMADDETEALSWASGGDDDVHGHRRYVYEVDPGPFVERDEDTHEAQSANHYIAPDAVIKNRIDIPKPSSYERPIQGTLAPYDWQKTVAFHRPGKPGRFAPGGEGVTHVNAPTLHTLHEGNPNASEWAYTTRMHDIQQDITASGDIFAVEQGPKPERPPEIKGQLGMQFR
jgi:hypothetical protein